MKKLAFLALALLLTFSLAHALLPSFGIKGGVNMANIAGSDAPDDTKSKLGVVGGAFVCLDLMVLKLQPELLYSQKGTKGEYLGISYTDKIDYLEIPVLLKFPFGKIIVPSIYLGPSLGVLVSAKETAQSQTVDFKDLCNSNDFGMVFGAEVKTPAKLSVEARYNMGLGKLFKPILGIQPDVKNSTISVMLGYYMF
jgi:hypothetical protein